MTSKVATSESSTIVPALCGADVELGNFILGRPSTDGTGDHASRLLLAAVDGVRAGRPPGSTGTIDPQDRGRKYLPSNGGCCYIDLDHYEFCLPEVIGPYAHLAAWHAMLRITRQAMRTAQERLPEGESLQVLVNNSDGLSHSYGGHLNFLVSRRTFSNIFDRRLHYQLFLASHQVSSIIYTGAGKVGAENDQPDIGFQLSQRADFFETLTGVQTTYARPLVNSRDEALCGGYRAAEHSDLAWERARLHCIFYDSGLCHVGHVLKVGVQQIVLAMIEAEAVDSSLVLEDPLEAVHAWSHDISLQKTCRLLDGREVTAIDLQAEFYERAQKAHAAGHLAGIPQVELLLALWCETLGDLYALDLTKLNGRIDWVSRLTALRAAKREHHLDWDAPEMKYLDHLYGHLDDEVGTYWALEKAGVATRLVDDAEIDRLVREPPENTRAWGRAMLLRSLSQEDVAFVDWDEMRVWVSNENGYPRLATIAMHDPLSTFTKAEAADVLLVAEQPSGEDATTKDRSETEDSNDRSPGEGRGVVVDIRRLN